MGKLTFSEKVSKEVEEAIRWITEYYLPPEGYKQKVLMQAINLLNYKGLREGLSEEESIYFRRLSKLLH